MIRNLIAPGHWKRLPGPLRGFVVAYLLCTISGAANALMQFEFLRTRLEEMLQLPDPLRDWVVYCVIALRALVALAILGWALHRQSIIARILIFAQLLGWLYGFPIAVRILWTGNWKSLPFVLAALSSITVVTLMFAPKSRQWFARKGRTLADDLEDFS